MSNYIFALCSLVLLVPILYFLPLGISRKGKIISVAASLCAAGLALAAQDAFLLWQNAILILLFIMVCAYIFGTRMTGLFFAAESAGIEERTNSMQHSQFKDKETDFSGDEAYSSDTVNIYTESLPSSGVPDEYNAELTGNSQEKADTSLEMVDDLENFLIRESAEDDEVGILSDIETISYLEESDDIEPVQQDGESTLEDVYAGTLFTENEEEAGSEGDLPGNIPKLAGSEELDLQDLDEIQRSDEYYYLADIEKMLDLPDQESEPDQIEEQVLKPEQEQEQEQEQESSEVAWGELEFLDDSENRDSQTNGDKGNATQENIDSIYDISIQASIELDRSALSDDTENGYGYYFDDATKNTLTNTGELDIQASAEGQNSSNRMLRHQVLQTAVDQLKAMKMTMSANDYEAMLKKCMISNLQPAEYYTFATILIQHYLSFKETAKLKRLLGELEGKYSKHPIIRQEIQFLQNKYFYN